MANISREQRQKIYDEHFQQGYAKGYSDALAEDIASLTDKSKFLLRLTCLIKMANIGEKQIEQILDRFDG